MTKQVVLTILDGWALGPDHDNAIKAAHIPSYRKLKTEFPYTTLKASGLDVGLPPGQMGNSEVGHLNIGAGRVVYQDLTRISRDIQEGKFINNPRLKQAMSGTVHLIGLLSDGGVHSHTDHLEALLRMAKLNKVEKVWVHPWLDGRDVAPTSAVQFLEWLETTCRRIGIGAIATISGRYYAMDRDKRWERVEKAYAAMVQGEGRQAEDAVEAVRVAYVQGQTDEFVEPIVLDSDGLIADGDNVICFNFRPDRAREITRVLTDTDFAEFKRRIFPEVNFLCMTQYDETFPLPVAYPPEVLENTLGQVVADAGLKQLRIAETEKYAHVTYFFNGGDETKLPGEDRVLIPSSKVATYDLQPEMSAIPVTDAVCEQIAQQKYQLVVLNYANPDMVGHTGDFEATVRACEVVDSCLERVWQATREAGAVLLITSDHGNADQMRDAQGNPHTAHTANIVPLLMAGATGNLRDGGALCDIAPTILELLGLDKPDQMTGKSLLVKE